MADERRDVSLRSRQRRQGISAGREAREPPRERSQASGRQQQQGRPSVESVRSGEQQRARPSARQNDSTTNMVKKRYSVRYGQAPDYRDGAPPMPMPPQIPAIYGQQNDSSASLSQQQQRGGLDIRALRDPNLQPDQYLQQYLATATEQEIAQYQQQLRNVQNRASTDLSRNVSQNRTQFIKIAKEAEKLKAEMQTLQGLMTDLSGILDQAAAANGVARDDSARKRANRSSVANLEAMWSTQLQSLWKLIEGSQKFVAAIPGRHVILEQPGWTELDAATWKPKRPAHLVLLNDNLLIALRKRKRIDPSLADGQKAPTKIVAERCFSLQDIDVIDLETSTGDVNGSYRQPTQIAGAITIRHGQEAFTYRTDSSKSPQKNEFVLVFKRAIEALRRAEGSKNTTSKSRDALTYLASRDTAVAENSSLVRSLSKVDKDKPEVLIEVEGTQRNMRWVEQQIDELDIYVAMQQFEEATGSVEFLRSIAKGLKSNAIAQELINTKVNERASQLADIIVRNLVHTAGQLTHTKQNISWLTRLDLSARARVAYLQARSDNVRSGVRTIIFEGNILSHITAISYVYFTLIKNTVSTFQQCFPTQMMSAVITWAKGQLDSYNEQLSRALSGVEEGGEVYREGVSRAKEMAGIMDEVGLDFSCLVVDKR